MAFDGSLNSFDEAVKKSIQSREFNFLFQSRANDDIIEKIRCHKKWYPRGDSFKLRSCG